MSDILKNRFKDERWFTYGLIEKLKSSSVHISSSNPKHKNGVKYMISRKRYNEIIENDLNREDVKHLNKEMIRDFVNKKLLPIK